MGKKIDLSGIHITASINGSIPPVVAESDLKRLDRTFPCQEGSCHAMPRCAGIVDFQATVNSTWNTSQLHWWIQRNQDPNTKDVGPTEDGPYGGPRPIIIPDPDGDTRKFTLDITTNDPWGSFNIILFWAKHDGDLLVYEPDWWLKDTDGNAAVIPLCQINIVLIDAYPVKFDIYHHNEYFTSAADTHHPDETVFYAGTDSDPDDIIHMQGTVHVRSGGQDGLLALKLSGYTLGFIGNLTDTSFNSQYTGYQGVETSYPNSVPMLDTGRAHPGTGWNTAFRTDSGDGKTKPIPVTPPHKGLLYTVVSGDSPSVGCKNNYPAGNPAKFVQGGNYFSDYLACYTFDFGKGYAILAKIDWSAQFNYNYAAAAWTNNGSKITGASAGVDPVLSTDGFPISSVAAGVVTTAPPIALTGFQMLYGAIP